MTRYWQHPDGSLIASDTDQTPNGFVKIDQATYDPLVVDREDEAKANAEAAIQAVEQFNADNNSIRISARAKLMSGQPLSEAEADLLLNAEPT